MKIAISGNGVMGQLVRKALETDSTLDFIGCVGPGDLPVLDALPASPDGIIDFSHPDCLSGIIDYVTAQAEAGRRIPVVIATTGYSEAQIQQIHGLSHMVPVVFSSNFSPGVTILTRLLKEFSPLMADWDIEIVETHHNRKLDVPSGTALMIAEGIREARGAGEFCIGRHEHGKRPEGEIGIHSLRLGNVVGEHEIRINTGTQTLTLKHEAHSRALFAEGALTAAAFLIEQKNGLFNVNDLFG